MYIGEVSKQTGLSIKTIRFYEERGLIPVPTRKGRYRVYSEIHIEILLLIREAKEFGVPLSRLKGVIVYKNGEPDWNQIKVFLEDVRGELEDQITSITYKINKISSCINSIERCPKA